MHNITLGKYKLNHNEISLCKSDIGINKLIVVDKRGIYAIFSENSFVKTIKNLVNTVLDTRFYF